MGGTVSGANSVCTRTVLKQVQVHTVIPVVVGTVYEKANIHVGSGPAYCTRIITSSNSLVTVSTCTVHVWLYM